MARPAGDEPCSALDDRVDLVGHQAVGLAVHAVRGVGIGRFDEAAAVWEARARDAARCRTAADDALVARA